MGFATFSDEQLHRLPVLMLRTLCRVSGVEESGRKAALVERLCEESNQSEAGRYHTVLCCALCACAFALVGLPCQRSVSRCNK